MELYDVLLFVHIVAVSIWFGGGFLLGAVSARIVRMGDSELRRGFMKAASVIGPISAVSALVVLGAGIGMVLENDAIRLADLWVWLGVALFVVSGLIGGAYFGPASNRIEAALDAGDTQQLERLGRQFAMVSRLDLLILLVIIGLMVFKPGG